MRNYCSTCLFVCLFIFLCLFVFPGSNPNSPADDGATPLYITTQEDNPECVEYLLEHGASATIPVYTDISQLAPIHVAADKGHVRSVKLNNV